jgi:hypothetical protein
MNRRNFITSLAAGTPGVMLAGTEANPAKATGPERDALGEILPTRLLGRTGERVTMLGIGGYHLGWTTERDAQEILEAALEGGIRFFDSAESYQSGESERRYGEFLTPRYREHVFLMTKTQGRDAKTAREHLEGSFETIEDGLFGPLANSCPAGSGGCRQPP